MCARVQKCLRASTSIICLIAVVAALNEPSVSTADTGRSRSDVDPNAVWSRHQSRPAGQTESKWDTLRLSDRQTTSRHPRSSLCSALDHCFLPSLNSMVWEGEGGGGYSRWATVNYTQINTYRRCTHPPTHNDNSMREGVCECTL